MYHKFSYVINRYIKISKKKNDDFNNHQNRLYFLYNPP